MSQLGQYADGDEDGAFLSLQGGSSGSAQAGGGGGGSSGDLTAPYIVKVPVVDLPNAQALSLISQGSYLNQQTSLLAVTLGGTGVVVAAGDGGDYVSAKFEQNMFTWFVGPGFGGGTVSYNAGTKTYTVIMNNVISSAFDSGALDGASAFKLGFIVPATNLGADKIVIKDKTLATTYGPYDIVLPVSGAAVVGGELKIAQPVMFLWDGTSKWWLVAGNAASSGTFTSTAKILVQTASGDFANGQAMGSLATGLVKNTTTTGVQSIAAQGTDYYKPGGTAVTPTDGGTGVAAIPSGVLKGAANALALATHAVDFMNPADVQKETVIYAADSGAVNVCVVTLSPAPASYTDGQVVVFKVNHTNTLGVTLNVNALGAKSVTKYGTSGLSPGDLLVGQIVTVVYDGTRFQLQAPAINPVAVPVTGSYGLITGTNVVGDVYSTTIPFSPTTYAAMGNSGKSWLGSIGSNFNITGAGPYTATLNATFSSGIFPLGSAVGVIFFA